MSSTDDGTPARSEASAGEAAVPSDWSFDRPGEADAVQLTALLRRHEEVGRGWPGSSVDDVLVEVSPRGYRTRENRVLRDGSGWIRGWVSAHDRAAGRLLLVVIVDRDLPAALAEPVASALFAWGEQEARRVAGSRGITEQQIDSGAFADDEAQHRWLTAAGFERVRTWWQMTREVTSDDIGLDTQPGPGVRIRAVRRSATGLPDEEDLRTVHDVLERAFGDHFNAHAESFDEFVARLREDPGHRWDHWWIAERVDPGAAPRAAGALVGSVMQGQDGAADGSYVEYIGVLQNARGRGVAKSLLFTVIADAAARGRDRVGLEVDADSPTGAEGLYLSLGWTTRYVTESWHRTVRTR